jgi:hypothetical protein
MAYGIVVDSKNVLIIGRKIEELTQAYSILLHAQKDPGEQWSYMLERVDTASCDIPHSLEPLKEWNANIITSRTLISLAVHARTRKENSVHISLFIGI